MALLPGVRTSSQRNHREPPRQGRIQSSLLLLFLPDQNTRCDASSENDVGQKWQSFSQITSLPGQCCSWCCTSPETFGILKAHLHSASDVGALRGCGWIMNNSTSSPQELLAELKKWDQADEKCYLSQLGGDPVKLSQQRHWGNLDIFISFQHQHQQLVLA